MRGSILAALSAASLCVACTSNTSGDSGSDVDSGQARDAAATLDAVDTGYEPDTHPQDAHADVAADSPARTTRTINGCDPTGKSVVDLSTSAEPTIVSGPSYVFTPACVRVRAGQTLIFRVDPSVDWTTHPLAAGTIEDGYEVADPTSPIPRTEGGSEPVRVTFTEPGSYGFYCTRHWLAGHMGGVHVVR